MSSHKFTGVVDRFEDDLAVILLEAGGEVIDEVVLEREELPVDAVHPDAVLEITLTDRGEVTAIAYDAAGTDARKEQAQSRFDRLSERPPSEDNS